MPDTRSQAERDLSIAVRAGNVTAVAALLDAGVPVDTRDRNDNTMLIAAVGWQRRAVIELLLARGADVNANGLMGPALAAAVVRPDTEITRLLLGRGAKVDERTKFVGLGFGAPAPPNARLLDIAIKSGQAAQVELLESLGFGALEPDAPRARGHLFDALLFRKWDVAGSLIRRGVQPGEMFWRIHDIARFLAEQGLAPPPDAPDWSFAYAARPMDALHPLWPCKRAIDQLQAQANQTLVRRASPVELAAIASFHVHPTVLEFFAHFAPAEPGGPGGMFDSFDMMMLANWPNEIRRCAYFAFGSEGGGDTFAFAPAPRGAGVTPTIVRVDHEIGYDGMSCEQIAGLVRPIASDMAQLLNGLAAPAATAPQQPIE